MLFKKKNQDDSRRVRQAPARGSGARPVFSYHARPPRADTSGGRSRSAGKFPWINPPKSSPRPDFRRWPVRTLTVAGFIFVLALLINSLFLSRSPEVIALADNGNRHVFLRSLETYEAAARTILAGSFANTNKLTIDTKRIAEEMQKQFPELENVSVTLPIVGRKPVVYIQPARPSLLLKDGVGGVFVVDVAGRALINASQVSKIDKMGLIVVEDQSGLPIDLGRIALPSDDVAFITEVAGQLKAKKVSATGFTLLKGSSELDVRVEGKPYIVKFNLRGDARAEAGAFLATKQHLERENKTPSSYIDVRVDNKVYYK